ncbi:MAG TPA: methyltransferase domain-containing protein [Dehalococcoidia bacterium]|nr:methyltransferase domain-containing protein [Dehalococcoidia bacterium]
MKSLDLYLRDQRFLKAKPFVRPNDVVLDIGCEDGALFESLRGTIKHGVGIDPVLSQKQETDLYTLLPGMFPGALPPGDKYDVITMLAVLEHIPPAEQARLGQLCVDHLNPAGRVVITVPSPRVDQILHVLQALRLIEAETLHEHYGFEVAQTEDIFKAPLFRLLHKRKFQLGLNNLFVFERL